MKTKFMIINCIICALLGYTISSLAIVTTKYNDTQKIENKYDLNDDDKVNSLDLLILKEYLEDI